jgi:hypothetical protein
MRSIIVNLSALGALASPVAAAACPDCPTARAARAALFDERFWSHSVMVLSPLLVLGAIAALAYRVGLPEPPSTPKARKGTGG